MAKKHGMSDISAKHQEPKVENPLSLSNILAGIIVTVLGGIILAYIIQDARFSPNQGKPTPSSTFTPEAIRTQSALSTVPPNSTQIVNDSTVVVSIEEGNTASVFDGKIFITLNSIYPLDQTVYATIGSPGCANQEIKYAPIGYAVIYECGSIYDIRIGSITRRDKFVSVIWGAEFYVTQLEK